jgi:hypothetical protein
MRGPAGKSVGEGAPSREAGWGLCLVSLVDSRRSTETLASIPLVSVPSAFTPATDQPLAAPHKIPLSNIISTGNWRKGKGGSGCLGCAVIVSFSSIFPSLIVPDNVLLPR